MAALPYMPLYVADYLADAAHLTAAGHGAYLLLIMTYWQRGEPLPSDERKLSRIARMTPEEWESVRDDIVEFFHVDDGHWRHKRIDAELAKVEAKSEQARAAGKASAATRVNGRSTDAQRTLNHTDTDTDTDTDKKTNPSDCQKKRTTKTKLPDDCPTEPDRQKAVAYWLERHRPDLSADDEAKKFRLHHTKHGNRMASWEAAWQTWYVNALEFKKPPPRGSPDAIAAALDPNRKSLWDTA